MTCNNCTFVRFGKSDVIFSITGPISRASFSLTSFIGSTQWGLPTVAQQYLYFLPFISNSSFTTSRFGPMTGIFSESKLTLPMSTVMKSPPFETTHFTTPPRVSTVKGLFSSTLPVSKR